VRHGSICSRCRTEDEAIFRLAVGAGSTLLCGRRGGPAGAWRGRVYRAERGRRSANHASWPPRPRGGRGGSSGAHPHTGGGRPPRAVTPPLLEANLRPLWQECTAGAPMRAGVLWAHLSLREVSRRRWALGTPARRRPIRRLRKRTRGRRTARKKKRWATLPTATRHATRTRAGGARTRQLARRCWRPTRQRRHGWGMCTSLAHPAPPSRWHPVSAMVVPLARGSGFPTASMP
jgi:hypothetical protein